LGAGHEIVSPEKVQLNRTERLNGPPSALICILAVKPEMLLSPLLWLEASIETFHFDPARRTLPDFCSYRAID
jgi:hypothetical protein